jgi:hypothetical protein
MHAEGFIGAGEHAGSPLQILLNRLPLSGYYLPSFLATLNPQPLNAFATLACNNLSDPLKEFWQRPGLFSVLALGA